MTDMGCTKTPSIKKLSVLVVDDHGYFRESLVAFLKEIPIVEVVGEAKDGVEGTETALAFSPDLVVMDIRMPRRNGIEASRIIKAKRPATKIILYSMYEPAVGETEGKETADRFIPKERLFEDLVEAIEEFVEV